MVGSLPVSLDIDAIADALRVEFAAVEAPSGTAGGTDIRGSSVGTAQVNAIPYILVEAPNGEVQTAIGMDPRRTTHEFQVYFLFQHQPDGPRNTRVMLQWLGPLLDALHANNALDIEYGEEADWHVLKSWILSYEPTSIEIAGTPYYAWHFPVAVHTVQFGPITP